LIVIGIGNPQILSIAKRKGQSWTMSSPQEIRVLGA